MQAIMPQVPADEAGDRIRQAIQSGDALRTFAPGSRVKEAIRIS
jgi:hypothetical protein